MELIEGNGSGDTKTNTTDYSGAGGRYGNAVPEGSADPANSTPLAKRVLRFLGIPAKGLTLMAASLIGVLVAGYVAFRSLGGGR